MLPSDIVLTMDDMNKMDPAKREQLIEYLQYPKPVKQCSRCNTPIIPRTGPYVVFFRERFHTKCFILFIFELGSGNQFYQWLVDYVSEHVRTRGHES